MHSFFIFYYLSHENIKYLIDTIFLLVLSECFVFIQFSFILEGYTKLFLQIRYKGNCKFVEDTIKVNIFKNFFFGYFIIIVNKNFICTYSLITIRHASI